jgi:hypothetical protein
MRTRQEDFEFKAILGYILRPYIKSKQKHPPNQLTKQTKTKRERKKEREGKGRDRKKREEGERRRGGEGRRGSAPLLWVCGKVARHGRMAWLMAVSKREEGRRAGVPLSL